MNTKRMGIAGLCAAVLCSAAAQPGAAPVTGAVAEASAVTPCKTLQRAMDGKHQHLVAFGTSLTWAGTWVEKLRHALACKQANYWNFTLCNAGFNSKGSAWGLQTLDERVLRRNPDGVFLEFGINDGADVAKLSVAKSRANLETLIDRILAHNPDCEIILLTTNPTAPGTVHSERRPRLEQYYQVYRDVAAERGLRLVDLYPTWKKILDEDPDLFKKYVPDGLHPGPLGDAQVIVPGILKVMGL